MPRAHRCFIAGHVWHLTHRCHEREFLLKFARDRRRWIHWLYEARKRFRLCVLDYIVTSNHIHMLIQDRGDGEIARSMQLIAGRTAQEYNRRKGRRGAFWEDRYHATAVDTDAHLARCLLYTDMNMVRAGVVTHPGEWPDSGYREIQHPPKRYRIIDLPALVSLLGMDSLRSLQRAHADWVDEAVRTGRLAREPLWTEALAVGSERFVANVQARLGVSARYREVVTDGRGGHAIREAGCPYGLDFERKNGLLRGKFIWYSGENA
jgi:putative transposase